MPVQHALLIAKLLQIPNVGSQTATKICNAFQALGAWPTTDIELLSAFRASTSDKKSVQHSDSAILRFFAKGAHLYEKSLQAGIRFVTLYDPRYPHRLKRLSSPPPLLNYKGPIEQLNNSIVCTVTGTRVPTNHGYKLALRAGELFGKNDFIVVAGLAAGCGTAAHIGCLHAGGITAAVLGHGLSLIYPRENTRLAGDIIDRGGLLISEYFMEEKPRQSNFIARNKIQAGLSAFIFIVEAGLNSGIRHTVKAAELCKTKIYAYDHPAAYKALIQTQGNDKWIEEGKATPIKNKQDFENILMEWKP